MISCFIIIEFKPDQLKYGHLVKMLKNPSVQKTVQAVVKCFGFLTIYDNIYQVSQHRIKTNSESRIKVKVLGKWKLLNIYLCFNKASIRKLLIRLIEF